MDFAALLTHQQVERVHEASLNILEDVGMLVRNETARRILQRHGCRPEPDSEIIKFPRQVVEEFRKHTPPKFTFYGREPKFDRTLPDDRPAIVTGSSAPNVIDPLIRQERRATSADIARIAHLVNALPGYDIFSISTLAEDAPPGMFTLARLYPAVKNCLKPIRGNAPDRQDAELLIKLGSLVAGSEAAAQLRVLRRREQSRLRGGVIRRLDARIEDDLPVLDEGLVGVVGLLVREVEVGGDAACRFQDRVEGFAGVVGEAWALAERFYAEDVVELEGEGVGGDEVWHESDESEGWAEVRG